MYNDLSTDNRVYLIYCDIGNYRHWVNESTTAEKFFSNFDKLKSALNELTCLDYSYYEPTPDKELEMLCKNEQKYIQDFLSRSWGKTVSEAAKLKTDKGRINKIKSFFDSLEPYKERFSKDTLQMLNQAKSEQPDYSLNRNSKSEKDRLFLIETEKILDLQNNIMNNIEHRQGHYAWFYQNSYLLERLVQKEIDNDIIYDLTRLMLAQTKNTDRYISLKYHVSRPLAKKICLTASRLVNEHRRITEFKGKAETLGYKKYFITTHGTPCEICQAHRGKIYNIKDAKIGVNFPPFCSHGCSTALLYLDGITEINQKPLSYPDKLFAKAFNLYEDEKYEEAAEQGLEVCLMVPESERYIQYVPEMLAKVKRYEEAVQILNNYIELNKNVRENYVKQRNRYQKQIK